MARLETTIAKHPFLIEFAYPETPELAGINRSLEGGLACGTCNAVVDACLVCGRPFERFDPAACDPRPSYYSRSERSHRHPRCQPDLETQIAIVRERDEEVRRSLEEAIQRGFW